MADDETTTSFRQFEYCPLCRISHKKRKKHIYSKRHQAMLSNILEKYSLKIDSARKELFSPRAESIEFERNAKFWCYFCASEFDKHSLLEECTVVGSGLLHHIARPHRIVWSRVNRLRPVCRNSPRRNIDDHKSNMEKFFWDNLLPKQLKSKYVLSKEDLHIFQKASFLAVKKWQKVKEMERQKIASSISQMERNRQKNWQSAVCQSESVPSTSSLSDLPGNRVKDGSDPSIVSDKMMAAYSTLGLTRIEKNDDDTEGNVHTGATPPWLKDSRTGQELKSKEIGPTMEDFQKYKEQEKKAKLPSCRVGAKFDRTSTSSPDWLPSFGRVWSKGRRLQSKLQFEKEWKGKGPLIKQKNQGQRMKAGPLHPGSLIPVTENYSTCNGDHLPGNKFSTNKQVNQVHSTQTFDTHELNHGSKFGSDEITKNTQSLKSQNTWNKNQNFKRTDTAKVSVVPYKRQKKNPSSDFSSIHLLQTPLLSNKK